MPSPIIAVGRVPVNWWTAVALSSGRNSARTSSMPAWSAIARAVRALSPVSMVRSMPWPVRVVTTVGTSGRSSSRTPMAPATAPSRWMMTTVMPWSSSPWTWAARGPGASQRGLPTVTVAPSRRPVIPCPAVSVTPSAAGVSGVAAVMAAANGWVLCCSSAAAQPSTWSSVMPGAASTAVTVGWLRVRVPVLSTARWRIPPRRSKAAPDLMTTPNRLAAPIAETTVTGTAMASAQGEAATNTTRARVIHSSGSPSRDPRAATSTARMSTPGTRGFAIRSASRARSPFSAWACSTRCTMVVRELSVPAAVASISRAPAVLIDPAETVSPGPTSTGMDSPVIAEVSRELRPVRTIPSVATRSPGRTTSTCPGRRSLASTSTVAPPARMVAVSGTSFSRARRPARARSMALSSRASAMEYRNARAAASSM